ncbi:MAG TPA: phosphatase PAP2 family protein, partial [Phototrophicaceae bacterium]|nr:phosphatase PAP2 family protein [Phototrophicaceae bacterium]
IGVLVTLVYLIQRRWFNLSFWIIALVGGSLLNTVMKLIVARPRPMFVDPLVIEQNYSFPSAHAMTSLIAYGILAYLLWRETENRYLRILIVFAAILLIVLIGISRMALGVHYFSDVVGGFAAGSIWLGICIIAINLMQRRQKVAVIDRAVRTD